MLIITQWHVEQLQDVHQVLLEIMGRKLVKFHVLHKCMEISQVGHVKIALRLVQHALQVLIAALVSLVPNYLSKTMYVTLIAVFLFNITMEEYVTHHAQPEHT